MVCSIIQFTNANIIDLSISVAIFLFIFILAIVVKIPKIGIGVISASGLLVLMAYFFQLTISLTIAGILYCTFLFLICMLNLGKIKTFVTKITPAKKTKLKVTPNKIIDHLSLFEEVNKACLYCSKNKIGALITFEKDDNLIPLTKNGTKLNAPVCSELLVTIFYPGTRLHDGAVIIRDGMLYAASVYYTPTTKALQGKYGSRHRAALGISEISDSVTVVVSEETGRISISEGGELISVSPDSLIRELEDRINS